MSVERELVILIFGRYIFHFYPILWILNEAYRSRDEIHKGVDFLAKRPSSFKTSPGRTPHPYFCDRYKVSKDRDIHVSGTTGSFIQSYRKDTRSESRGERFLRLRFAARTLAYVVASNVMNDVMGFHAPSFIARASNKAFISRVACCAQVPTRGTPKAI